MIGIIIQARNSSTRLPNKVIKKIQGKTVLEHIINRAKKVKNCEKVVLATTNKKNDDILVKIAKKANISVFRGSENDVLDRFYQAAKNFEIDPVVRITADCPLLDPHLAENIINFYKNGSYDYVSNVRPPTFPDGLDVEIFRFAALEKAWLNSKLPQEREHVYPYIFKKPGMFKIGNFVNDKDFSHIRLTLDVKNDLTLIKKIYKKLYSKNPTFGLKEILKLLAQQPDLIKINQNTSVHSVSRWKKGQTKL